ncbi:myogenesis-regulating glycosidase-like isoform X2 [Patiria miniata]|uniref:Myogenesis-regulating glycosidase n=1 Tax=Patiria miniata TaxID=46514 RepID=A0A914BQH4_PATMI|nr:myogenesis-regulating glycosidase-like isoform X2 [Patiria miniata]XP_038078404.1 myogenesis-regulating glycosidase-like isoform X2 [Patiria miniata]
MLQVRENSEPNVNAHTSLLVTGGAPSPMASTSQVVVDAEGNGSISLEVPSIDHHEVKKRTKATVDPNKVDIAKPLRILKKPREIKLKISIIFLFCLIVASTTCILVLYVEEPLHYKVGNAMFYAVSREFDVHLNGANITRGLIGMNLPDMLPSSCDPFDSQNLCLEYPDIARLLIHVEQLSGMDCYNLTWEALSHDLVHRDCYSFENIHWYGGGVSANQQWPLEKMNQSRAPFVSGHKTNSFGPVVERFWLASHGVGIRVNDESPLFVSINEDDQKLCFEATYHDSPFPNPKEELPKLQYTLCAAVDMPSVHQKMMDKFSKKLRAVPQQALSKSPMWSVPACSRKSTFNETTLLQFASAIRDSKLGANSLEIQCDYTTSEGDVAFDAERFSNIATTISRIRDFGMDVAVGITLFMNTDSKAFQEGLRNQYLVEDPRSQVPGLTKWKDGVAGLLDVTSSNATSWFLSQLKTLQNTSGVSFFTFDYGQVSYLPVEFQTMEDLRNPCTFTQRYVELADKTNGPVIMRSAFQSQDIPFIVQTIPKTSVWGYENGLKSLIPTVLTLSILGYPFTMPDLEVRGQHYDPSCFVDCLPDKEFLLRWLGVIAFFPAMKINVPIWEYDQETVNIADQFIKFHQETIAPLVVKVATESGNTTATVIRPLWWTASSDPVAQSMDSEFLIGNDMLVAPVLDLGLVKRQVYLPEGKWVDQLHGTTVNGGAWVECEASLNQVPYFTRA